MNEVSISVNWAVTVTTRVKKRNRPGGKTAKYQHVVWAKLVYDLLHRACHRGSVLSESAMGDLLNASMQIH